MSDKQQRHSALLGVIGARRISRQEDLIEALKGHGISATQSTLSKDMKELGIAKVPEPDGGFRYQAPLDESWDSLEGGELLVRELRDFVTEIDGAGHTLVLKTITGHAQGVCEAIDRAEWDEVVGTLAGENTIFVLCRTEERREAVASRVRALQNGR